MTPCYNFYFATNVTVRGNRRGNYACVSLFYSTAFVIVIRLVYKNLCYWPIRIYFGMLATDCCITFIQWKARTQELLSRVRDRRCTLFRFWFSPVFQRLDLCYEVFVVPHSSPEIPAQFPILCMYLMGSNWSSAYRSASRGNLL